MSLAIYHMHQKSIKLDILHDCELVISKFVAQVSQLYGDEQVSYDAHLLVLCTLYSVSEIGCVM